MSGLFGSVTIKGNRITDFAGQTATVGIPIPFGYGRFPVQGNIIAASELREKIIRRRQGKGGVKTEDYEYTCDYAIGFCEGPIYGYWTIKRDGKVVYSSDPAAPIEDQEYAAKWLEKATLYYGTEDQEPDSTLEAFKGVGMVSAFKGLAYIVLENDNVTAGGGAVPQYEAVPIANSIAYLTTPLYPVESVETFGEALSATGGTYRLGLLEEEVGFDSFSADATILGGELRDPLRTVEVGKETFESSVEVTAGTLRDALITYQHPNTEAFVAGTEVTSGTLRVALITAETLVETFEVTTEITGGTLT